MAGIIITVSAQKGGSGKTLLASLLAMAWRRDEGAEVAVLDVDPQGSLGEWYERREAALGEEEAGLTLRTASGWGARRESRALSRDCDVVVVDTPPHADLEARSAMELADLVVVPVQPTPADLWTVSATLEHAARAEVPALVVLNRVPPRARLTAEIEASLAEMDAQVASARLCNRGTT